MSATVEIREDDGVYTAVDSETGAVGSGKTRAIALAVLSVKLQEDEEDLVSELDSKTALRVLGASARKRFEEEDVTEDDVEDAIAWARSE
jgi:hypothetical protein